MTRKPCPLCKLVVPCRKADDICHLCQEKFDSIEKLKSIIIDTREKGAFSMPVIIGPAPHWNKHFRFPGNSDLPRKLQQLFFDLAMAASVQSFDFHDRKETTHLLGKSSETEGCYLPEAQRCINPNVAKCIIALHGIMERIANESYASGQSDAKDIIEKFNEIRKIVR